jgi:hypothetical protein
LSEVEHLAGLEDAAYIKEKSYQFAGTAKVSSSLKRIMIQNEKEPFRPFVS